MFIFFQVCFGEIKKDKGNEFIRFFVQKSGQKFVIGIFFFEKFFYINFDFVFEDDFELFYDWKYGSVYFVGYKVDNIDLYFLQILYQILFYLI